MRLAVRRLFDERGFTAGCAIAAAGLSLLYIAFYLRGGPRIIDATSYYLEARALAEGHFAWPVADPAASVAGRFLVRDSLGGGDRLGVIFPPGYPALLAIGFALGAPLLVGPLLAAAIVVATARVTAAIARRLAVSANDARASTRLAALLSTSCACLRYHTADTMSHGLAAALILIALGATLAIVDSPPPTRRAAVAPLVVGLALGFLAATRPVTAAVGSVIVTTAASTGTRRIAMRELLLASLGVLPGVALLLLHQHAVTGAWMRSSQSLYYAVSDGPPDCFRYGFGTAIGCRGEHGAFVHANLENGFDAIAAAKTTLRRLKMHAGDALNAWPLAPITLAGVVMAASRKASRVLAIGVAAQIALYAPFYFDGNYPGGGARFNADTLPLELVAIALFVPRAWERYARRRRSTPQHGVAVASVVGASVAGFALFGRFDHAALRDREGGRPMFEEGVIAGAPRGSIVFVDTDHGFDLGFDPDGTSARPGVLRYRGDLTDWIALTDRGMPPSFRYDFALDGSRPPSLVPYAPRADAPLLGASLWPPLRQEGGYAERTSDECARDGASLSVERASDVETRIAVELPRGIEGALVTPRVTGAGALAIAIGGELVAQWTASDSSMCGTRLAAQRLPRLRGRMELTLSRPIGSSHFALDAFEISATSSDEGG